MLSSDIARYQIQDRVHQAESYRRSRSTRAGRAAERRSRVRTVGHAALAALLWPVRH